MIEESKIRQLLELRDDGSLFHRESQNLEFKEQFNLAGLGEYLKDFAGFANNKGGYLIFGVSNSPRKLIGLTEKSIEMFNGIDPEKISGFILEIYSSNIEWSQEMIEIEGMKFGVFYIHPAVVKPVIAKRNEGQDNTIKNGEIYYRYGGRTQKIQYSELENIIMERVKYHDKKWEDLFSRIAKIGPTAAAVLDTKTGLIDRGENQMLFLDKKLLKEIEFVDQKRPSTSISEKTALKIMGEVHPVDTVEIERNVLDNYPITATQLVQEVKKRLPEVKQPDIYQIVKDNDIKNDRAYSAYVFRSKEQEEKYKESGNVPKGIGSIYNEAAIEYLEKVLRNKLQESSSNQPRSLRSTKLEETDKINMKTQPEKNF